ncbi:hypothetical protein Si136_00042 [Streptococcus infantarius subsp. infantarius]|nr:hypothetical protein [Streptococcus infantarius subsp. infantarius]
MKTNSVPKIRFKGFTDDWEQRKFGELYEKVSRKNDMTYGTEQIISVANMYYKVDANVKRQDYLKTYNIFELGDIAFEGNKSKHFAHGRFVENTIGNGIVSHVFDVFKPIMDFNLSFWKYYINYEGVMGPILTRVTKASTMMTNLVAKDFLNEDILVPSIAEQQKIGEYLSNLDHLITLHQRKCEQTKELKKFMLQKMFPKKGEKNPEIRFPGFTDAWEQRKLESLCEVFTDGDWIEAKDQSNSGVRLIQTGNIGITEYLDKENNKKWISEETLKRLRCEEVYPGDILISRLPDPAGRACILPNLGIRMITAVDCTIIRTSKEYDSKYLVQYLSTPTYFKIVNSFLGGGTRQRISRKNLSKIDIPVPHIFAEQQKIGEYFSNLDHLITLHQRKCEQLKELKKFMLQNMFPKKG